MKKSIWVLLESENNKLKTCCPALMEEAARLARELDGEAEALYWGDEIADLPAVVAAWGIDRLLLVDHPALAKTDNFAGTHPQIHDRLLTQLVAERKPFLVMAAATPFGADLFSRVAPRLKAPLVTHCLEVKTEDGLEFIKPIQNGRLHATVVCEQAETMMATFIPEATGAAPPAGSGKAVSVARVESAIDTTGLTIEVIGHEKADPRTIDITEADTIIAVGRGLGTRENLAAIQEFADQIGAAIGGTRPMVDLRVLPYERQIGQTGKRVTPGLILLCGISGAMEFVKGIENAGTKLAINTDPDAPIFKTADVAIQGDLMTVIGKVAARLKEDRQ